MPVANEADPAPKVLFVFRDSPTTREALEQRAIREQTTPSDIMRRALASYLDNRAATTLANIADAIEGALDDEGADEWVAQIRAIANMEDNSCTPAGRPSVTKQGSSDGD